MAVQRIVYAFVSIYIFRICWLVAAIISLSSGFFPLAFASRPKRREKNGKTWCYFKNREMCVHFLALACSGPHLFQMETVKVERNATAIKSSRTSQRSTVQRPSPIFHLVHHTNENKSAAVGTRDIEKCKWVHLGEHRLRQLKKPWTRALTRTLRTKNAFRSLEIVEHKAIDARQMSNCKRLHFHTRSTQKMLLAAT